MSTNTQPRQPSGTPVGGQFAGKANPEPDVELAAQPDFGAPWGNNPAYTLPDGRQVAMWRKGQRVRFYDTAGDQVGPEQSNVAPAAAYAYHHGWVAATDMPEEHDPPIERQWAMVGVTDPEKITSAMARGYSPEDYTSEDRDLRMAAHAAAGEMVFEGTLLSNATELWRHEPDITDKSRVFHHPSEVYFKGNPTPWAELPAEDQLDYIRGYARAIVTGGDQDQRPRVEWDNAQAMGFVCGVHHSQLLEGIASLSLLSQTLIPAQQRGSMLHPKQVQCLGMPLIIPRSH